MLLVNSTAINALQSQIVDATMKISGDALTNMKDVERDDTYDAMRSVPHDTRRTNTYTSSIHQHDIRIQSVVDHAFFSSGSFTSHIRTA